MGKKESLISALGDFKQKLQKKIDIKKMVLFGSYARGDYKKHSDVDLIIVSPNFKKIRFPKRSWDFYNLWNIDLPVDYLCFTPEEFEKQKKKVSIVSMALKEGIVIN